MIGMCKFSYINDIKSPLLRGFVITSLLTTAISIEAEEQSMTELSATSNEPQTQVLQEEQNISSGSIITVRGNSADMIGLPGSVYLLDEERIRLNAGGDVNRLLREVPGVYVREEDGFGLFPNISLRGVDTTRSAKVSVLEDGIPVAPAPYSAPAAYYSPMSSRMQSIEVRKGSSQTRFGPHSTGGVINYVATQIPYKPTTYARLSYGTDATLQAHAYAGAVAQTKVGTFGGLLELNYHESEGFQKLDRVNDPNYYGTENTGFEKFEPVMRLFWEPNSNVYQRVEIKLNASDVDANQSYLGLNEADFQADPYRRYAASRFDNFTGSLQRASLVYEIEPNENFRAVTTLYTHTYERDWFKLHSLKDIDIGSGTVIGAMTLSEALLDDLGIEALRGERAATLTVRHNDRTYDMQGIAFDTVTNLETGSATHDLRIGLRYHYDSEFRFQQDVDYDQNDQGQIQNVNPVSLPGFAGHKKQEATSLAIYGEDEIFIGPWRLLAGLRAEFIDYKYEIFPPQTPESGSDKLSVMSGGFGFSYTFDENWVMFSDLFSGVSTPTPESYIKDKVNEERSLAFELGARWRQGGNGSFHAQSAFFWSEFNDLLVIDNIGGTGTGQSENVGQVRSLGLEALIGIDLGIENSWSFSNPWNLSFTYTDARLVGDAQSSSANSIFSGGVSGNKVPYIPDLVFSLDSRFQWRKFGTGFRVQYQGETYTSASNIEIPESPAGIPDARFGKTDSYFLVDIDASYQVLDTTKVFIGIENLLDEAYVTSRHPHGPRPGRPQFFYGGVELQF